MSIDPIGFNAGDASKYRYVLNNVLRFDDPSGEFIPLVYVGAVIGGLIISNIANTPSDTDQTYQDNSISGPLNGIAAGYFGAGGEINLGNSRIAPLGNRTSNPLGQLPHYHRKVPDPKNPSQSAPGQGGGRHRPWQNSKHDKCWMDRF